MTRRNAGACWKYRSGGPSNWPPSTGRPGRTRPPPFAAGPADACCARTKGGRDRENAWRADVSEVKVEGTYKRPEILNSGSSTHSYRRRCSSNTLASTCMPDFSGKVSPYANTLWRCSFKRMRYKGSPLVPLTAPGTASSSGRKEVLATSHTWAGYWPNFWYG